MQLRHVLLSIDTDISEDISVDISVERNTILKVGAWRQGIVGRVVRFRILPPPEAHNSLPEADDEQDFLPGNPTEYGDR